MAERNGLYFWTRCRSMFCIGLFLMLSVVAFIRGSFAEAASPAWPAETRERIPLPASTIPTGDEPAMVVSLDGKLHAIDPVSQELKWSFSSGPALSSSYRATLANERLQQGHDSDHRGPTYVDFSNESDVAGGEGDDDISREEDKLEEVEEEWSIFPGPDGQLYVQDASGVTELPVNVKQLVDSSPHVTEDGALVLSTVTSTAFLLNRDTGALIRTFDKSGNSLKASAQLKGKNADVTDVLLATKVKDASSISNDTDSMILCLRTDYSVAVQEMATGELLWNVSLGEIKTLPIMAAGYRGGKLIMDNADDEQRVLGEKLIERVAPTNMMSQRPIYRAAPIALYSSSGEFVKNLVPEEVRSPLGHLQGLPPGLMTLAPPSVHGVSTKTTGLHAGHVHHLPVQVNHRELVPVLEDIGQKSVQGSHKELVPVGQKPIVKQGSWQPSKVDASSNDSVGHRRDFPPAPGPEYPAEPSKTSVIMLSALAVSSIVGVVVLGLWMGTSSIKYFWMRKREADEKEIDKKVGNSKKKKGRKAVSVENALLKQKAKDLQGREVPQLDVARDESLENPAKMKRLLDTTGYGEGTQVGRLFVTKIVIGSGSNGTTVLEGFLDGRNVAVKRLLGHYYEKAQKEIDLLIASDEHPNVVRYYAMEETSEFIYVALERCSLSLHDLIVSQSAVSSCQSGKIDEVEGKQFSKLKLANGKEVKLWNDKGQPSRQLLQLMRDIAVGLAHLHLLGIVHRDLKPHNVLVSIGRSVQAKLADMGLSKYLENDASSFQDTGRGAAGSRGWQAPEQLLEGRQTRAVDIFSLGCVLFFCITGGQHSFGEHYRRDNNIVNGEPELFLIADLPEAHHLIEGLLQREPAKRPLAHDVTLHPLFWSSQERLSFLRDASDRVELEDREENSVLLTALEAVGSVTLGGEWHLHVDEALLDNLRKYRRYNYRSVRDLLRFIRNKSNHYRELPPQLQELLGPVPEGYESYFSARFPRLLIEVYKVLISHCKEERMFQRFFTPTDV